MLAPSRAELEEELPSPLDVPRLEPGDAEPPARPAAAVRDRRPRQAGVHQRALLVGGDRALEIAGEVPGPAELEQRPVEVVRAGRQPRRLERRLAALGRLSQTALHLEGEVLGEGQRHDQPALAERACDHDAPFGMGDGIVVVLQVRLGPGEVVERLEARRQLGVREAIDLAPSLQPVLLRLVDMPCDRLTETQRGHGRRCERRVAHGAGRRRRPAAHLDRLLEIELVQPVHGELDLQRRGLRGRVVGELVPGAGQATVGFLVAAEPVLDGGAARRQLDPAVNRVRGEQLDRLQQRGVTAVELTQRAERRGEGDPHVHLALGVGRRQQAQRRLEPARRRGRRT